MKVGAMARGAVSGWSRHAPLWIGLALACAAVAIGGPGARARDLPPVVSTDDGQVQGLMREGVREFLGLPYAAAPVGPLRWRPPEPHVPWRGVRTATRPGDSCPQNTELAAFSGPASETEDCLYLNIFAPPRSLAPAGARLPVLVWLHGGALLVGAGRDYDGSALARGGPAGPVVVVTLNYRVGLLGFLAHPALDGEEHEFGNYGFMDQRRALDWVSRNISRFGGDPDNITLAGQSSGGSGVVAAMVSPNRPGVFHKAILQSGLFLPIAPLAAAERKGLAFAKATGCTAGAPEAVASCLRRLPVRDILALQDENGRIGPYVTGPIGDGVLLPRTAVDWTSGDFRHVPVISGTTLDEGRFDVSVEEARSGPVSAERYAQLVRQMVSPAPSAERSRYIDGAANALLASYPASGFESPALALAEVITDNHVCPLLAANVAISRFTPLYVYEFSDRTAPWYFPPQSFPSGAAHTADIQYFFPLWRGGNQGIPHALSPVQRALSTRLVNAWTRFMYTGDPDGPGVRDWPRDQPQSPLYASQGLNGFTTVSEADFAARHRCALWHRLTAPEPPSEAR